MPRYLIIRNSDGLVVNAVEWDGDTTTWQPPPGHSTLQRNDGNPGDMWNGTTFIPAPLVVRPEEKIDALVDILEARPGFLNASERARLRAART